MVTIYDHARRPSGDKNFKPICRLGINPDHIVLMLPNREDPSHIVVATSLQEEQFHVTIEDARLLGWED